MFQRINKSNSGNLLKWCIIRVFRFYAIVRIVSLTWQGDCILTPKFRGYSTSWKRCIISLIGHIHICKFGKPGDKLQLNTSKGAISMLGDNYLTYPCCWRTVVIFGYLLVLRAIQEHYNISILFNRSGFS